MTKKKLENIISIEIIIINYNPKIIWSIIMNCRIIKIVFLVNGIIIRLEFKKEFSLFEHLRPHYFLNRHLLRW